MELCSEVAILHLVRFAMTQNGPGLPAAIDCVYSNRLVYNQQELLRVLHHAPLGVPAAVDDALLLMDAREPGVDANAVFF
jgi:hypothetical protein